MPLFLPFVSARTVWLADGSGLRCILLLQAKKSQTVETNLKNITLAKFDLDFEVSIRTIVPYYMSFISAVAWPHCGSCSFFRLFVNPYVLYGPLNSKTRRRTRTEIGKSNENFLRRESLTC